MIRKTVFVATLGLLLISGSSWAERRMTISPRQGPDQDVEREQYDAPQATQFSRAQSDQRRDNLLKPVHITGTLRASRGRGVSINGQNLLVGSNCGFFPVSDPERIPDPRRWNGRRVTIFGFRTRVGIDARLMILQDDSRSSSGTRDANMIPSANDPTVGEQRRGTPG